ncbi:MAG: 50S ribosomal protein L3 N(5)-glutamine methyltransferase [Gammaproteobacteria bacterium]|nr:50S ribosomal protein L3 N(5)-glutamine methyltransferase [Rhodocyclaceae bacterium]MBU3909894.1 50S ribosomal protein L3 N(5)-glutamine methyltransferase [Gammaproteobacteria bacterium]MBU3988954.1 50S ribosomal protein L3 N(5)-glutamine methyltransferase [Gammaproteobacteria bacterium]MBU4003527.1 50S ribosomal protein L3 N(5)-glutamine methyltransferase [Gammaproteobacteria bacterium]MBU4020114.1 50S ribosomal protein L3 N(5)-glutamine methyltransferase [Gammaproteobacteria bacterium]
MTDSLLDDLITVRDWLRWGTSRFHEAKLFFGHGCDNAHDEAAWLVLAALHLPPDHLAPYLDARLARQERLAVLELLQQRIARRVPAAYLTHEAWQAGLRFYVDERVLIPRSYFADLLVDGFAPWIDDPDAIGSALDLCTGSGCLAILMAHAFPNAKIDAADISDAALAVAKRNVTDYGLQKRVKLVQGDLFAGLGKRRYNFILSNPPYVTAQAMRDLPPEYRHEPQNALAAGHDGLDIVRRILADAAKHLKPSGMLAVEVGHNKEIVEAAFPELPLIWLDTPSGEGKLFMLRREDFA